MALTKSVAIVDEWQAVAQNVLVEGATVDVSGCYQATLSIAVALTSATASTNGMEVRVQVSSHATNDEHWVEFISFQGPTGTANSEAITNNPLSAASTTITCASTTGYTLPTGTDNGWRYIKDSTIANSETILQTGLTTNTNITIMDGTTHEHAQNTLMYNIVGVYVVTIPDTAYRVRIVYNNTKDAAGSTADVHSCISKITAI